VNESVLLQTRDFVLHQQLATLQLYDLEIVNRRMRTGFADFRFQSPVPSFKFRKMRLYGHVVGFSSVRSLPDLGSLHPSCRISKPVSIVQRSNPDLYGAVMPSA
jgi:hypothetical protein